LVTLSFSVIDIISYLADINRVKLQIIDKPSLFYGFRLRHALALLICLGIILMLAGYFSVSAGQKASLEVVKSQGRALTETLISSAQMVLESDDAITSIAIQDLSDKVDQMNLPGLRKNDQTLENLRLSLGADKVAFVNNRKIYNSSTSRSPLLDNDSISDWLDSLQIDPDAEIIYDFRTINTDRYLWSYFPTDDTSGLFAAIKWKIGQYGNERLSLYYLLNQVGQESGIEYIMLQNQDGIVFASKKVASMPKLDDDSFLVTAMKTDTTSSRLINFQDREVLESVRIFKGHDFEGIFRVGLSLYGYRQITSGVRRQVWLVVAALVIIGMLAFGFITGFQNFEFLKSGFEKAQIISQSLLDSIPGPVIAIDSLWLISDINSMARERFGLASSSAVNTEYHSVFPEDPFRFRQVIESRRSSSFEKIIGEDRRQYFITTTPLFSSTGESIGAISIAQDITEARKLEGMAESRRRLSELGALAASMAHEIRNPLNAIGMTIQRMRNEIKPAGSDEDYYKFIDILKSEIKRLNDIIEKFLIVARSVRQEITPVNITEMIQGVLELFDNQAQAQKIKVSLKLPDQIIIDGDRAGLTQALMNIIKNSLEAVGPGGEINIEAGDKGEKAYIRVKDNGPGISDISSALKPFYTTKQDGTGLGLATASKILADHGGELIIDSSPGEGTLVELVMPKRKASS
jgi:signal transduction histidine kinase